MKSSIPVFWVGEHDLLQDILTKQIKGLAKIFAQILPKYCPILPEYRPNFGRIRYVQILGGTVPACPPPPSSPILFYTCGYSPAYMYEPTCTCNLKRNSTTGLT